MIRVDAFEKETTTKKPIDTPKLKRPTTVYFKRSNRAVFSKSNYSPSISCLEVILIIKFYLKLFL